MNKNIWQKCQLPRESTSILLLHNASWKFCMPHMEDNILCHYNKPKRASTISQSTCPLLTNLTVEARQTCLSLDSTSSVPREAGSINDPLCSPEPPWLTIERMCPCMTAVMHYNLWESGLSTYMASDIVCDDAASFIATNPMQVLQSKQQTKNRAACVCTAAWPCGTCTLRSVVCSIPANTPSHIR